MSKTCELLTKKEFTLIVSLPDNRYDFAKAAWEAGADAIKVHINVAHNASKITFYALDHYKDVFEKILKDSPVPVGIVIGNEVKLAEEALDEVLKMGFDFISLYGRDMPVSLGYNRPIKTFYAIDEFYNLDLVKQISKQYVSDVIEASILNPSNYGKSLSLETLLKYQQIVQVSKLPVIIPTQHYIKPSEIKDLKQIGVKGLMIGAVVTSNSVESIYDAVTRYKDAIIQN